MRTRALVMERRERGKEGASGPRLFRFQRYRTTRERILINGSSFTRAPSVSEEGHKRASGFISVPLLSPPPLLPSIVRCASSLSLLFPMYDGIFIFSLLFLPFISISRPLRLSFRGDDPPLFLSVFAFSLFFSFAYLLSLYLSLSFYLSQRITLLAVMSSMKHYTRQCHSSRRGPPREEMRCRVFPDVCTAKQEKYERLRGLSLYADLRRRRIVHSAHYICVYKHTKDTCFITSTQ